MPVGLERCSPIDCTRACSVESERREAVLVPLVAEGSLIVQLHFTEVAAQQGVEALLRFHVFLVHLVWCTCFQVVTLADVFLLLSIGVHPAGTRVTLLCERCVMWCYFLCMACMAQGSRVVIALFLVL